MREKVGTLNIGIKTDAVSLSPEILRLLEETRIEAMQELEGIDLNEKKQETSKKLSPEEFAEMILDVRRKMQEPEFAENLSKKLAERQKEYEKLERMLSSREWMNVPFTL